MQNRSSTLVASVSPCLATVSRHQHGFTTKNSLQFSRGLRNLPLISAPSRRRQHLNNNVRLTQAVVKSAADPTPPVPEVIDPSCEFDWMLGVSLAGCAFEAYNGLDLEGSTGAAPPIHQDTVSGTRITYVDPEFLRTRMQGILEVTVIGAKNLKSSEVFGKSDPYCTLSVGGSFARTPTVQNDLNPTWNHTAYLFITDLKSARLTLRVLDEDFGNADDFLGASMRGLADLENEPIEVEMTLSGADKCTGSVTLRLNYEPFSIEENVLQEAAKSKMAGAPTFLGAPSKELLTSPWRDLGRAMLPTASDDDYLGLDALAFIDNPGSDTQTWMFWNKTDKKIVVAYRGTETSQLMDVLTDLALIPTAIDPEGDLGTTENGNPAAALFKGLESIAKGVGNGGGGAKDFKSLLSKGVEAAKGVRDVAREEVWVHSGFINAYRSVRADILALLDVATAGNAGEWTIYICGHSLGGALSTLGAYEAATRRNWQGGRPTIVNYSFGSPRVGNRAFAEAFNEAVPNAWRVVNNNDAVPLVPRLLGFAHVGHQFKLSTNGSVLKSLFSRSLGEGADVGDLASAVVGSVMWSQGGEADDDRIETADDVAAVVQAEILAMKTLLDGSAVDEHMVCLF